MTALTYNALQGSRGYWLLVAVDLSLRSKARRRQAQTFKRFLIRDGFEIIQPSLYARFCTSTEVCVTHQSRVCKNTPELSKTTFVRLTDLQFRGIFRNGKHASAPLPISPDMITFV